MAHVLRAEHSAGADYATVLPAQLVYLGVLAVPLAVAGVRYLAGRPELRFMLIALGLVLLYVVLQVPGRPYYVSGFLPLVLAAGAVAVEARHLAAGQNRRWLALPLAGLVVSLPVIMPVLPISVMARLPVLHKLNYDAGETIGWPQLTDAVAGVYTHLPPAQRRQASIFTMNYGEAGALSWFGPASGLPAPLSGHNGYFSWGPGQAADQTVIAVGAVRRLRPYFDLCRYDLTWYAPHGVNNDENGVQIWTCTAPHQPWTAIWPALRVLG